MYVCMLMHVQLKLGIYETYRYSILLLCCSCCCCYCCNGCSCCYCCCCCCCCHRGIVLKWLFERCNWRWAKSLLSACIHPGSACTTRAHTHIYIDTNFRPAGFQLKWQRKMEAECERENERVYWHASFSWLVIIATGNNKCSYRNDVVT